MVRIGKKTARTFGAAAPTDCAATRWGRSSSCDLAAESGRSAGEANQLSCIHGDTLATTADGCATAGPSRPGRPHRPRTWVCRAPWDTEWRAQLVDHLEILTRQLWQVGITEVFADG